MKRLHFTKPNNLSRLHDELLAAIPALRPVGAPLAAPVMTVEGLGDNIWLTVPDAADEPAIASIVQAHDSLYLQPTPSEQRRSRITDLLAIPRSDWTVAQYRELLQLVAQEQLQ